MRRVFFARAAARAPAVLFIDELDAVGDRERVGGQQPHLDRVCGDGFLFGCHGRL